MENLTLNKLEYYKILNILSTFAITSIGKEYCLELLPLFENSKVEKSLNESLEANTLIQRKGNPPISFFDNTNVYIKTLKGNLILSAKGLLELAKILEMSRNLKEYFNCDDGLDLNDFSILSTYFNSLYINSEIEKTIFSNVIDENTISDNASKKLYTIRKNLRKLEQDIKDKLRNFIHSSSYSKYIQEAVITIRNGRFVIPVKQEYKSQIKGFVHDISSSGSTVFIEPMSIFDLNNEISNLKVDESIEVENILKNFTNLLSTITLELENNIRIIGRLDFIFAKAKYSISINAIKPFINSEKYINLQEARHPLIDPKLVVPIDINLGNDFSCLVITGPNTGGKTVSLKTVGLLSLMAMSGLLIPAKEGSSIYVFDNIFADIGDEQSIQENLSTFSSHMKNVVNIIKNSTSNSLILLDELGSGTDPIEGASLAISVLEYFYNCGSLIVATTHYSEIKHYALLNKGFKNASCEFDIENLRPTYKLLIGIPGKSNAFAICKKIGIKDEILNRAKNFLSEDSINIEDLLKNLHDEKAQIDNEKSEIDKNLKQIELLRKNLEHDNSALEEKSLQLIEDAKQEARNILLDAKDTATQIIRDIKNNSNNINELENLRNNLNTSINKLSFIAQNTKSSTTNIKDIKLNQSIYIISLNQNGKVLSLPNKDNKVLVQVGSMKVNVNISDIVINTVNNTAKSKSKVTTSKSAKSKLVSNEINVIGLTVDEAIPIIDKYIDDLSLSSLKSARIVHGKGTGKLRSAIHSYLKKNSNIKNFRLGTFGEGEMGVTIIEIK